MIKKCFIIILIIVLFFSLFLFSFIKLGEHLLVKNPLPENLDVIFVFGGTLSRIRYAIQLIKIYPDSYVIVNNNNILDNKITNTLLKEEINTYNVLIICIDTINSLDSVQYRKSETYSEILYLKSFLQNNLLNNDIQNISKDSSLINLGIINVGLVSSGFHMRRIKLLVDRNLKDLQCNFWYLPSDFDDILSTENNSNSLWNYKMNKKLILREIIKYIYTLIFIN